MVADRRTTGQSTQDTRILKGCQKLRIWHPVQDADEISYTNRWWRFTDHRLISQTASR